MQRALKVENKLDELLLLLLLSVCDCESVIIGKTKTTTVK